MAKLFILSRTNKDVKKNKLILTDEELKALRSMFQHVECENRSLWLKSHILFGRHILRTMIVETDEEEQQIEIMRNKMRGWEDELIKLETQTLKDIALQEEKAGEAYETWRSEKGTVLIRNMEDSHLLNAIEYVKRKAVGKVVMSDESASLTELLEKGKYSALVREAQRRGLLNNED